MSGHTNRCACKDEWRFEACDLATGTVRAILHPLGADWQTTLNEPGQGSLTLATREVSIRDVFPHLASVYILRIAGGRATPLAPVVEGAFMLEELSAEDSGTTSVGMKGIEEYLNRRVIRNTLEYGDIFDTELAASIANRARIEGIPLSATAVLAGPKTESTIYPAWERKNIGEAVQEITEYENGPDWELRHTKTNGRWATEMVFLPRAGVVRELTLKSEREASGYGLSVDASEHATAVDGLGAGDGEDMLIATAIDGTSRYPRFDATPAYKDTIDLPVLGRQSAGYLDTHRHPFTMPSAQISGLDPDPSTTRLGDTVNVDTNYGAVTYRGPARIVSRSWNVGGDGPTQRTFDFIPDTLGVTEAMLGQQPVDICKDC